VGADTSLVQLLVDLGAVEEAVRTRLADQEIEGAEAVPTWLLDMLRAVRDGERDGWIDYSRSTDVDDTNVLDFLRGLPELLPVTYENNEESWLFALPDRDLEVTISWEGSCYKVSRLGRTWDEAPAGD